MFLGRMRKHLAGHNWSGMMVDVIVVIVSILLAFQIDRWAEQRREQHTETEYLLRLRQDLQMEVQEMESALEYADDRIKAVNFLAQVSKDLSVAEHAPERLPWAVETATWRSFPQITAFVYGELQSTGNLALIEDDALRRSLAGHYTRLRHHSQVGMDLYAQHRFEGLTAGLLSIEELVAVENGSWGEDSAAIDPARALEIAGAFSRNDDAVSLLPSLVQHHTFNIKVINEARKRTQQLIAQIDALVDQPD